jgi:hypothetical protein
MDGRVGKEVLRWAGMAKKRAKKKTFSAVKAVKSNARDRVGQPKAERVIEDTPREQKRKEKHKATLSDLLSSEE